MQRSEGGKNFSSREKNLCEGLDTAVNPMPWGKKEPRSLVCLLATRTGWGLHEVELKTGRGRSGEAKKFRLNSKRKEKPLGGFLAME